MHSGLTAGLGSVPPLGLHCNRQEQLHWERDLCTACDRKLDRCQDFNTHEKQRERVERKNKPKGVKKKERNRKQREQEGKEKEIQDRKREGLRKNKRDKRERVVGGKKQMKMKQVLRDEQDTQIKPKNL